MHREAIICQHLFGGNEKEKNHQMITHQITAYK